MTRVVVVGAGVAGLTAAWELAQAGVEVVVLESEGRPGGLIVTERPEPGWIVEGGPDGFHGAYPDIPDLAATLGVADRLVPARARGAFGWDGEGFYPLSGMDAAELLGIETRADDVKSGFMAFAEGMDGLLPPLVRVLGDVIRLRVGVTGGQRITEGFRVNGTGGASLRCDGLVVATPAYAAARIFQGIDGEVGHLLASVRYRPSLNVSLAYARDQVRAPLDGSGFVVQPEVGGALRACTYASVKFSGRAPDGFVLLRAFLASDVDLPTEVAHTSLAPILRIGGAPRWTRVFSWPRGLPRRMGHSEYTAWSDELSGRLARLGPIALAGGAYESAGGGGLSACVRSGRAAGRLVASRLAAA